MEEDHHCSTLHLQREKTARENVKGARKEKKERELWVCVCFPHSVYEAVLAVFFGVQHAVFDEDWNSSQDERHKQVHVDEVPGTVKLPVWRDTHEHSEHHITVYLKNHSMQRNNTLTCLHYSPADFFFFIL